VKIFMQVSQFIRNVLLAYVTLALMLLTTIGMWLMDEKSIRKMKEKLND
jgi:hypothetical protein